MANILIDVGHPAHVHLFRNAACHWQAAGHELFVSALDREMILELLAQYDLPYAITYKRVIRGQWKLIHELPIRTLKTLQIARQHKTDLFVSMGNPIVGVVAKLMGKPYLATGDTEPAYNQLRTTMPFVTCLLTPDVFYRDAGTRHVRYAGYHELAYLHPDVYTPDASIYDALGLAHGTPYSVVRFVAWNATHDVHEQGFALEDKISVINLLKQHGEVVVSSESPLPEHLRDGVIVDFPRDRMADMLSFSQVYVGEGNTMASEAAVLGTPSIRVNSMDLGYCRDLQARELMFQRLDGAAIVATIEALFALPDRDATFAARRQQMLADKINTTDAIIEQADQLLQASR